MGLKDWGRLYSTGEWDVEIREENQKAMLVRK